MPHEFWKHHGVDDTRMFYLTMMDNMAPNISVARYLIGRKATKIPWT